MKYIEDCHLRIDKGDFTDFERCKENHNKNLSKVKSILKSRGFNMYEFIKFRVILVGI